MSSQQAFEDKFASASFEVFEYFRLLKRIRALEEEAAKCRQEAADLLKSSPLMGNVVGAVKKEATKRMLAEGADSSEAPLSKKRKGKGPLSKLAQIEKKEGWEQELEAQMATDREKSAEKQKKRDKLLEEKRKTRSAGPSNRPDSPMKE